MFKFLKENSNPRNLTAPMNTQTTDHLTPANPKEGKQINTITEKCQELTILIIITVLRILFSCFLSGLFLFVAGVVTEDASVAF